MKILHISAVKTFGGGENHILNLYNELLDNEKVQNFILTPKSSAFHGILKRNGISAFTAPLSIKFDLRFVFRILRICRKEKIDLIHIHDPTALTLAVTATKFGKLPDFIFSKKTSFPIKQRKSTLYKYNHPQIKKMLCVSAETCRVTAEGIRDSSKLVTIYHGTTMNKSTETPFRLREEYCIPKDKILVGTIANHIRAKNLETWVAMIDYIVNCLQRTNFHFIVIGSPTKRSPALLEMISEKKLEDHITLTGFLQNASNFIPQFDISLLTSQSEGVPQFIYESFYHRVPVVSTNVGGIPEIIENGTNGYISPPHQPELLARNLIALHENEKLKQQFVEISAEKLQKNFTTRVMAEKTLDEYKKVLYGES